MTSPSITYSSTRGSQSNLSFRTAVMTGLAHDRGLFVPDTFPTVSTSELESWRGLSYADLATEVIAKYVGEDEVPRKVLGDIVRRSCGSFRSGDVTPLVKVDGHYVLELFHGPTFAFKDVALQMLGNFFEYFLSTGSNGGRLAVLGATSGDTGSAAIYGLRGKKGVDCIILFPDGRVSEIQERQMTTVKDGNIHCVSVEGTFDDCQDIVKASFDNMEFRNKVKLGAVNSINWCRVLAQTTYYFWSYLRVTDAEKDVTKVNFSVPTGNFGDILAGYYAKRMGLPVGDLIVATNENDILHRFFTHGEYHREDIHKTISPSMDICVSSNFERYLYHLAGDDSTTLASWMSAFESTGKLTITGKKLDQARADFKSARADTANTLETIKRYHSEFDYVLCPHSAVGVSAIHQLDTANSATVALATAHFAKFGDAVSMAINPLPDIPKELSRLWNMETRKSNCPNDATVVQAFMEKRIEERVANEEAGEKRKMQVRKLVLVSALVGLVAIVMRRRK
ncbi:threonine synthase [Thalassiosira pseudonana CCMP1335]|uniref:Threonine synthase n=1 Tax=Thalassiosira pseudonana TaxID=35128 RepID=B8CBR8_THAPS|nr:threonine synthase [Thalassiosira pseudonana CCMP1335]EED89364.1 threonine synthase [Thalassiosira pseudonana CCMP1335]|eukprot:scaffold1777_cov182-Alexandrium_tamarense.AAC.1